MGYATRMLVIFLLEILEEKEYTIDLSVDVNILLNYILGNIVGVSKLDLSGSR